MQEGQSYIPDSGEFDEPTPVYRPAKNKPSLSEKTPVTPQELESPVGFEPMPLIEGVVFNAPPDFAELADLTAFIMQDELNKDKELPFSDKDRSVLLTRQALDILRLLKIKFDAQNINPGDTLPEETFYMEAAPRDTEGKATQEIPREVTQQLLIQLENYGYLESSRYHRDSDYSYRLSEQAKSLMVPIKSSRQQKNNSI